MFVFYMIVSILHAEEISADLLHPPFSVSFSVSRGLALTPCAPSADMRSGGGAWEDSASRDKISSQAANQLVRSGGLPTKRPTGANQGAEGERKGSTARERKRGLWAYGRGGGADLAPAPEAEASAESPAWAGGAPCSSSCPQATLPQARHVRRPPTDSPPTDSPVSTCSACGRS